MKKRIGVIAGSFDPITNGHAWLIEQALGVVDELFVVVGNNLAKKHTFSVDQRIDMVEQIIKPLDGDDWDRIHIRTISNELLVNWAASKQATHLIRGIRNTQDFEYEHTMQLVNKKLHPQIETIFFIPPSNLTEVSSSTVKSLVGFEGWKDAVSSYVHPYVLDMLEQNNTEKK